MLYNHCNITLTLVSGRVKRTKRKANNKSPPRIKNVPDVCRKEPRRMGVAMATTKLPIQLAEVVKDTAIPEGGSYWKMIRKKTIDNYTAEL